MNIKEVIKEGTIRLKINNIESPNLKARLLMQYVLKQNRQYILVYDSEEILKEKKEKYFKHIEEMLEGKPIEHITNSKEFMKLNFYVDENVLIPRQDTEILVEEVIEIAKKCQAKRILDLCTGSGAIGISLAKYIENIKVDAVDISPKALEVAKKNAKQNNVEEKITFIKSDLFENIKKEKYDIIVSNPPYIKKEIIKTLDKEVQKEPVLALDGGEDGLQFYKLIIQQGYEYLKNGGYIVLEIGYDQKEEIFNLIEQENKICNNYNQTYSKKDLYEKDRIVVTKFLI